MRKESGQDKSKNDLYKPGYYCLNLRCPRKRSPRIPRGSKRCPRCGSSAYIYRIEDGKDYKLVRGKWRKVR